MSTAQPSLPLRRSVSEIRTASLIILVGLVAIALPFAATQMRSSGYLPHLYCYLANGPLVWTHVISDVAIGLSYVAISYTLLYLVRRSQGRIPFHWLLLAFGLFIVACGATHFMEVLTIWRPYYWVSAAVKVVTAAASVSTAIALPLICPTILKRLQDAGAAADRRVQLEEANLELERLNREQRETDKLKNALVAQQAVEIGDWTWNMKTGENIWSEAVEVMHGLAPGTYDGHYESWWNTVHPDDRDSVTRAIATANETGEYEVEYRTLRPDQSTYWTAARGRVVHDQNGVAEKMVGICMDVTTRKANEKALLRAEKLAAAGRLAATVAHEINNPLEAVTNLVYIARLGAPDIDNVLALAERELARVSAIARQTLSFYRDTASPTEFRIRDVVAQVIELYAAKIEGKRLRVECNYDDTVVRATRGDLHQVFANILSNAVDASPIGGTIRIRVVQEGEGGVSVEIEDDGPGISEAVAQRLFEPFFTTKRDVGTGLGLWVSRRLMEQMGGEISYTSRNSGSTGTCFRIRLAGAPHELGTAA